MTCTRRPVYGTSGNRGCSPHPSWQTLSIPTGQSTVVGVTTGKFRYVLTGQGKIFGVRFKPGAAQPFLGMQAATLTDQMLPLGQITGSAEEFLLTRIPPADPNVQLLNEMFAFIITNSHITRVSQLTAEFHLGPRTLQRLFHQYIGVGPKWVIRRYRLIRAADQLITAPNIDWASLAADLGYYDQAHLINSFTTTIGRSPTAHARLITAP